LVQSAILEGLFFDKKRPIGLLSFLRLIVLKFYYHPLSPISRRVWIALLEKELPFDPVVVDLRGKQFEKDFLAISPFHHVPVVVHEDVRVLESIAILDYLDRQFRQRPLSPTTPADVARMRMLQLMVTNELLPKDRGLNKRVNMPNNEETQLFRLKR